jgi:CRISPR type III-A-associated RAMP protein Csm4
MTPGFVFKLRPTGPWRIGPDDGARDRADLVYRSDALYSAVTAVMRDLGLRDAWLDATARADAAAVRFSSCFPWVGKTRLIAPPRHVWPPVSSAKLRSKSARFIPVTLVADLLAGKAPEEHRWMVDTPGGCLLPVGSPAAPFRFDVRTSAAVDRLGGGALLHSTACLEFGPNSGLWGAVAFADPETSGRWSGPVKTALRILADSGFGGGRSRGWGRSESPEFRDGFLPGLILRKPPAAAPEPVAEGTEEASLEPQTENVEAPEPPGEQVQWLLSLFAPAAADAVDWGQGSYTLVTRSGRVESPVRTGEAKKFLNMIEEGSVLVAPEPLLGAAVDVSPDGFPHPVYRFGCAFAIPVPRQVAV